MKRYKVTLEWSKHPIDRSSRPGSSSQAQVVEAQDEQRAKELVLSGYDFNGDAREPAAVHVEETSEPVGLQPYKT